MSGAGAAPALSGQITIQNEGSRPRDAKDADEEPAPAAQQQSGVKKKSRNKRAKVDWQSPTIFFGLGLTLILFYDVTCGHRLDVFTITGLMVMCAGLAWYLIELAAYYRVLSEIWQQRTKAFVAFLVFASMLTITIYLIIKYPRMH